METLKQDLIFSLRMMKKQPGFTAAAVLALTLGIGANAVIFSMINSMLLRPLPVEEPDRLVSMLLTNEHGTMNSFSYSDYRNYRDKSGVFSGIFGHSMINAGLSGAGAESEVIWGEIVTGEYFSVLGVKPVLGRGFLPEEASALGAHPVVVISHNLWKRRFASGADLIGKTVMLNGRDFTVVGIAPETFLGTKFGLRMDFWAPITMHEQLMSGSEGLLKSSSRWLDLIARLNPGVSIEQADAAIKSLHKSIEEIEPGAGRMGKVTVIPEKDDRFPSEVTNGIALATALAFAVTGLVLLIACANVANLLLARASVRRKEIGVRLALGASRTRLVRQLLTESALLALLGGAGSLLLVLWASDFLSMHLMPPLPYPIALSYRPDGAILPFTFGVSILSAFIFGLVPALQTSKLDLVTVMKGESGTTDATGRRFGLRNMLVVFQAALSIIVLSSSALFLRSLQNAQSIDPGFKIDNLLIASIDLGMVKYEEQEGRQFYKKLMERLQALPGIVSVNLAKTIPLGDNWNSSGPVIAEGQAPPPDGRGFVTEINIVCSDHFKTMGIPLRGRDFDERDLPDAPAVAVINEALAERLWPGENAIGRRFRVGGPEAPFREVVGVAQDVKVRTLGEKPRPYMYRPFLQAYRSEMSLIAKTGGDPKAMIDAVRREVRSMDARLPVYDVKTMEQHMGYALWSMRLGAVLSGLFGLLALTLSALGLYGVMAYMVAHRTREIGVRVALGAQSRDLLKMVIGQGMMLTLIGTAIGLAAALALARVMSSILYGVSPYDPFVFASASLLLAAVALAACWIPARRAAKVDPIVALRYE